MTHTVLTRGTVIIDVEACKGCELCIPACPPQVLVMTDASEPGGVNAMGFRYPELLPGCTGCRACLDVCPDFCFEVFKYDAPVTSEGEGPVRSRVSKVPVGRASERGRAKP